MEIKYNLSIDAWVKDIVVSGNSEKECKENLLNLSLQELIESGIVKDFTLSNIESEIESMHLDVKVTDIKYNLEDTELPELAFKSLPEELNLTILLFKGYDLDDEIKDAIYSKTDQEVLSYNYRVLKTY